MGRSRSVRYVLRCVECCSVLLTRAQDAAAGTLLEYGNVQFGGKATIKLSTPVRLGNQLKAFALGRPIPVAQVIQVQSPDNAEFRDLRPRPPGGSGPEYSQ
jgi:hypothetical protein